MKEFVIYTSMRVLLFLAAFFVVLGVWKLVAGDIHLLWAFVIAFIVSGIGSYFLLNRQREAFARRVEQRAQRVNTRYEALRSREDED